MHTETPVMKTNAITSGVVGTIILGILLALLFPKMAVYVALYIGVSALAFVAWAGSIFLLIGAGSLLERICTGRRS